MTTFLIPFIAFIAVILIMLMIYGVWIRFADPRNKSRKHRLHAIHNVIHWGGQTPSIAQTTMQDSALEAWLRSHSRTFEQFEKLLQRAHTPLAARHVINLILALFTLVMALGLLRQANPIALLVLSAAIAGTPVLWLSRKADKRRQALERKLPETLDYISRALRAGHSLASALSMVGKEFPDPIGSEFKTVSDEMAFGIPFKNAIGRLADRVQSNDVNFFVISVMVQHETGGNLTELLDKLGETIRERFKLRGKIRTLSSEGRASAWILGSMPFVLAAILTLINPRYVSLLWTTSQGRSLIYTGAGLMVLGFFMLKRIIQIKV